jgi:hypothetical protein
MCDNTGAAFSEEERNALLGIFGMFDSTNSGFIEKSEQVWRGQRGRRGRRGRPGRRGRWRGSINGVAGLFPSNHVGVAGLFPHAGKRVRAVFDFAGTEGQISFATGDIVYVCGEPSEDWWFGNAGAAGESGLFPSNRVEVLEDIAAELSAHDASETQRAAEEEAALEAERSQSQAQQAAAAEHGASGVGDGGYGGAGGGGPRR